MGYQGRFAESETLQRETLEIRRRVLGERHPDSLLSLYNLGCLAALQGDRDAALDRLRRAVDEGFAESDLMATDPDLTSLHGEEFDNLVAGA